HSVREGLRAAGSGPADEAIHVHDGARPQLTAGLVEACLRAVAAGADAAIAAAPVTDTVKQAGAPTDTGLARVERTLDRSRLWAVQTPQAFRRAALTAALDRPEPELAAATDDASLVEADGGDVRLVPAPRSNLKVTVPEDLRLAELLLGTHRRPGERAEPPSAARQSGPC
ncbi:MAG: 2-C-methyl-D-erythritol 4-phosphate cytidylyltransferase, partial [Solirubrobacteraceae bacterium]